MEIPEDIQVTVEPLRTAGKLKAQVDVTFLGRNQVTIARCKLIENIGGALWFAFPCESFKDKGGKAQYISVIRVPESLRKEIESIAIQKYEEKMASKI